jgi:hypothetical protein
MIVATEGYSKCVGINAKKISKMQLLQLAHAAKS